MTGFLVGPNWSENHLAKLPYTHAASEPVTTVPTSTAAAAAVVMPSLVEGKLVAALLHVGLVPLLKVLGQDHIAVLAHLQQQQQQQCDTHVCDVGAGTWGLGWVGGWGWLDKGGAKC